MAVREQPGERLAHELALTHDDAADLSFDRLGALGEGLRREALGGGIEGGRRVHGCLRFGAGVAACRAHCDDDGLSELK